MENRKNNQLVRDTQGSGLESGNILIVDDNEDIVELLKETIADHTTFKILTSTDPHKALDLVEKNRIDIVLLDMVMPKMNGIEVFKILRNRSINVPIIFLTGRGDEELKKSALSLGAFDFLSKPIKAKDLLILIDEAYKTIQKIRRILAKAAS